MSRGIPRRVKESTGAGDVDKVLEELDDLEETVSDDERAEVRRIKRMLEGVPGTDHIHKYTSRDMGESVIGALVFSLPLLVEDGVFAIAEWFLAVTIGPVPVFLTANVLFVIAMTAGLLYAVDLREVENRNPILGVVPRRLAGVLVISFLCAFAMMLMWGRLHEGDPTPFESLARTTVIWAAAALGAVLADILPGESKGEDVSDLVAELADELTHDQFPRRRSE